MNPYSPPTAPITVRGQRFVPTLDLAGRIVRAKAQLVRAEDPERVENTWQVVLSPVWQFQTGPVIQGVPARHLNGESDGQYLVEMTWGGGGVTFTTEFDYPAQGGSFAVAGDNVMLSVISNDLFTVHTEQNKPCLNVWVVPTARPTTPRPIVELGSGSVIGNITAISPWSRTLTVTKSDPAATVVIEYSLEVIGTFVVFRNMTAAEQSCEIPIPSRAQQVRITTSAGTARAMMDLVFT
jgi:hypothetical protein